MDGILELLLGFSAGFPAYLIIFLVLLGCGLGIPIPEDVTLFAAGLLAYYQKVDVFLITLVSLFGVLLGDGIIFYFGTRYGMALTKRRPFNKVLSKKRLELVKSKLEKQGKKVIFSARFMPGLRAPIYFTCGTTGVPFRDFLFFDGLAALLSVPAIVYSVYFFGDQFEKIVSIIKSIEHGILFLILGVVFFSWLKWYWKRRKSKAVC